MWQDDEKELCFRCEWCNEPIYRGDEYYSDGDITICVECYERFGCYRAW